MPIQQSTLVILGSGKYAILDKNSLVQRNGIGLVASPIESEHRLYLDSITVNHIRLMLAQLIKFLVRKMTIFPVESVVVFTSSSFIILLASETWNPLAEIVHIPEPEPPVVKHRPPERLVQYDIDDALIEYDIPQYHIQHLIERANSRISEVQAHNVAIQTGVLYQEIEEALSEGQMIRLGLLLCILGHTAIQAQQMHTAEVYLQESMSVFQSENYEPGIAYVNLQFGYLYARNRVIAMTAGRAYDDLQVGRWYLVHNKPDIALGFILNSIERNNSINRFASVASAYYSLIELYSDEDMIDEARTSLIESLRMFASSGRVRQANDILENYAGSLIDTEEMEELQNDLNRRNTIFELQLKQVERARDYQRLYLYYRTQSETSRAWKFRSLANNYLKQVPERVMFYRQPGVLSLLYESNQDADFAREYLMRAHLQLARLEMPELSNMVIRMIRSVP
ncbi:MAG: hypothetical protein F4X92_08040 [Gammaproteobacteria bacterium]|nr:hypothetical protein [Gammaproteobacteria bacterium]